MYRLFDVAAMKFKIFVLLLALLAPQCMRAEEKPQLFGVQKDASSPVLSAVGNLLAVSDEKSGGFQMWDVASRRSLWKSGDYFLAFSDDDSKTDARSNTVMVARGGKLVEGELRNLSEVELDLLDARDGRLLRRMKAAPDEDESGDEELLDFGFSNDERQFWAATENHLRVYDVKTGSLLPIKKWSGIGADSALKSASFLFDKEQLIGLDDKNNLVILDAHSGQLMQRLPQDPALEVPSDADCFLSVHSDESSFSLDFSLGSDNRETPSYVVRLSDGQVVWRAVWPTFSPDGQSAYVPIKTGLDVLDARTGRKLRTIPGPTSDSWDFSPDGNWIYEARDDKIWKWRAR